MMEPFPFEVFVDGEVVVLKTNRADRYHPIYIDIRRLPGFGDHLPILRRIFYDSTDIVESSEHERKNHEEFIMRMLNIAATLTSSEQRETLMKMIAEVNYKFNNQV